MAAAWRIELALATKADLALIGAEKRKTTEGRPAKETVVNNDNSLPKHNTRAEIALSLKEDLAKLARERQGRRTDLEDADSIPANLPGSSGETRDALADMAGVSGRTLDKVKRIERHGVPRVFRMDFR